MHGLARGRSNGTSWGSRGRLGQDTKKMEEDQDILIGVFAARC